MKFGTNHMVQPGIWTELGAIMTVPTGKPFCFETISAVTKITYNFQIH